MQTSIIIRELQNEDIEALAKLYYQFWNEESDVQKMKAKYAELRCNPAYIYLCAVEGEKLVGSVMGVVCESIYGGCTPFLAVEDMIVDSGYHRKGIGKKLFKELENRAMSKGCDVVLLVTETNRANACGFYESMGFSPTEHKGYKKKLP